jgi:uncharacterized glyoxalase superfamily protein PhnB
MSHRSLHPVGGHPSEFGLGVRLSLRDPFLALAAPAEPVAPDPAFATALRARIERALNLPPGVAVSTQTVQTAAPAATAGITPYLAVADARRALEWYAGALGASPLGEPIVMPDGRVGHAEIAVAGARVMLSDAHPEIGVVAPQPGAGATVTLHVDVPDVDALVARAVGAGAVPEREPGDNPYGRIGVVRDPFGHRWMLNTPPAVPQPERTTHGAASAPGDVVYVTMETPDSARARAFYGAVLGWTFHPGRVEDGWGVDSPTPMTGLSGGHERPAIVLMYQVDDIHAAVARVRAAGGTATDPEVQPYGISAECTDDQGTRFYLGQI